MQAGNAHYRKADDLPEAIPVFPLSGALLLPGGRMPLNVFEPRYLQMVEDAIGDTRLIGMIQPRLDGARRADGEPELAPVGCIGRIVSWTETGDGRLLVALHGVARFRLFGEIASRLPYRRCRVAVFAEDLDENAGVAEVDRDALLAAFRNFLDANGMETDWESVSRAENGTLVNALSMMAPYGAAEKQALLEAPDLKTRAETLVALTEIALARGDGDNAGTLQ
ncbi:MAG: LON peptidase substrate-binding domain-containing protein [Phyllobacteriaceae bacterium]|nr:LON peptidase substrate-binding domain-containing protein [Phyllobacteriaceae bacterium]